MHISVCEICKYTCLRKSILCGRIQMKNRKDGWCLTIFHYRMQERNVKKYSIVYTRYSNYFFVIDATLFLSFFFLFLFLDFGTIRINYNAFQASNHEIGIEESTHGDLIWCCIIFIVIENFIFEFYVKIDEKIVFSFYTFLTFI